MGLQTQLAFQLLGFGLAGVFLVLALFILMIKFVVWAFPVAADPDKSKS